MIFIQFFCQFSLCSVAVKTATLTMCVSSKAAFLNPNHFLCVRVFSVVMNPSKRHFLQKKALYEEGRIETPELLSSADLCASARL